MNLGNIKKLKELTKVTKRGEKLLILATAPDVKLFFENDKVRDRFKDYDVAFLNRMPLFSEAEMHIIKPRYIVFFDSIFYDRYLENGEINERRTQVDDMLKRIDWRCTVVTPILAEYGVDNDLVDYLKMSVFSANYNVLTRPFYRHNWLNVGFNNVVMGAIYFGITFGYKEIGIMGFTYRGDNMYMDEDGLHMGSYPHYYDENTYPEVIENDRLFDGRESYLLKRTRRVYDSEHKLCMLARYAMDMGVEVTNYTPRNCVVVFKTKSLDSYRV